MSTEENVDRKNYMYARRKIQIAHLALDGDWEQIRRLLDYMDAERKKPREVHQ
jgi:hypothetical protein